MNQKDLSNLTLGSLVLLLAGIFLPVMTIEPQAGEYTGFVKMLAPEQFAKTSFSLWGGVLKVIYSDTLIGIMLLTFSVIFPVTKCVVFLWHFNRRTTTKSNLLNLAIKLGKYSMLDIFVLSVLVIAIKGLPGGTIIVVENGFWLFGASVLLNLYVGQKIKLNP